MPIRTRKNDADRSQVKEAVLPMEADINFEFEEHVEESSVGAGAKKLPEEPDHLGAAACKYWKIGCNIVVLKDKKPLHEWQKWINERQTEQEFSDLPWTEATQYAIVCGAKIEGGLFLAAVFLAAVDFDIKNLPMETVEKGRELTKQFPITQMESTPSGGVHLVYLCREKPETVTAHHNDCALEILGEGKLCIMAPSEGYNRLNDNTPAEIQSLNEVFNKILTDSGFEVKSRKTTSAWFDREDLASRTYKGKTPPCINKILNGSPEGLRNEYGIRLASYFLNFRRFQPQAVQKIMKDWNRMNTPSLDMAELDNIIKSAVQRKYVYGCSDPTLSQSCVKEECPITKRTIVLTEAQKEHAEKILAQNNLLDIVVSYGHKKLIGEDNTLIINFIEICSGQTLYPISGIISGYSGSGKNESLRAIKPLIPEEWLFWFSTSTPEAVKYIPEEFAGTLMIYEASGIQSKTGSLGLRAVGEGESIETIYPMRDEETGKMTLGRAKTNAKNFITTESAIDIEPDLYRRVLKKSMNSSYVLTKRVCAKVLRESHLPDSLRDLLHKDQKPAISAEDFQNALRVQDWKAEVVLFTPEDLLGLIDVAVTVEQQVALRTQFNKILSFIKVLALLNQKRRVKIKLEDKTYVVAGPEDYKLGLTILGDTILETVSRIEKRQRDVLELFDRISPLDKNKVAQQLKVSTVTAAKALKTLNRSGYLQENTTAKTYTYEVMRDKPSSIVILQDTSKYSLFYEKELKSRLDHILSLISSGVLEKSRVKIENVPEKWDTSDKTSDKMPSEPIPEVSEQKETKHLVFDELTSKNKPDKEGEKEG